MKKDENLSLDNLILSNGKEFDSTKEKLIESSDINTEVPTNQLMYDDATIVPGAGMPMFNSDDVALDKEAAEDNLMMHVAMNKLADENAAYRKMTDDEKVKDYICQAQFYRETNEFYHKYGYEMSGKQKRYTKRAIEMAWKKGKLKVTPEQREDILFELSKASNQKVPVQAPPTQEVAKSNISDHIKDLNSLIFR